MMVEALPKTKAQVEMLVELSSDPFKEIFQEKLKLYLENNPIEESYLIAYSSARRAYKKKTGEFISNLD